MQKHSLPKLSRCAKHKKNISNVVLKLIYEFAKHSKPRLTGRLNVLIVSSLLPNIMNSTVLKEIIAFLFGRKYYANIVATKGTTKQEICSYIFATKEAANRHRLEIETTLSFTFVETVTFRSRRVHLNASVKS